MATEDGSEDVNDFLLRIRELGDQRDKEDEERTRKLEEEIIQGRKERQARRAERAKSLSPTKDPPSNADSQGSVPSAGNMSMQEAPLKTTSIFHPPRPDTSSPDDALRKAKGTSPHTEITRADMESGELPQPPSKSQTLPSTSPSAAMPLSRAGTLSWQQRPSSRGSTGPRSRPLSMFTSEIDSSASRVSADTASAGDSTLSREEIAQSLSAKDPTWFKQTQDRGLRSAAYKKNQEGSLDRASMNDSLRLPGMSERSSVGPESRTGSPLESFRSSSPGEASIRSLSRLPLNQPPSASGSSMSGLGSPLPTLDSQRFEPPSSDTASSFSADSSSVGRALAMSPAQGRISPERLDRPISPTKGLGGFVQSAMMKRSDSVNKRWSAQAAPGLSRGNSVVSNTSSYGTTRYPRGGITPLPESRPNSMSRENSPATSSRPGSSHSNTTVTRGLNEKERPDISTSLTGNKPELTPDEQSLNPAGEAKASPPSNDPMSPPASPSKRWSPSKASWLENAIKKPDSPKVKMAPPQQPAWMADITRAKQQRGSVDISNKNNFKEVTIGGLVRSPPPGASFTPPSISGLSSGFNTGQAMKLRTGGSEEASQRSITPETENITAAHRTSSPCEIPSPALAQSRTDRVISQGASTSNKEQTSSLPGQERLSRNDTRMVSPPAAKAKPATPPKKDSKSALKPRPIDWEAKGKDEPEFKNVFGKLKRTQPQNYVAPDELKNNIMRGKAALAQTGGPKKTERKDEFKESILQKKQAMVAPSASTRITSASAKIPNQSTPEAIARKNSLIRSGSMTSTDSTDGEKQLTKPEALAKLQHLREKPKSTLSESPSDTSTAPNEDSGSRDALGGNFASSLAGILQRGPSPMTGKPSETPPSDEVVEKTFRVTASTESTEAGPQLTHATKARAKGPKRRLPTASKRNESLETKTSSAKSSSRQLLHENRSIRANSIARLQPSLGSKPDPRPLSNITNNNNNNRKVSQPASPRKPSTSIPLTEDFKPTSPSSQLLSKEIELTRSTIVEQKPTTSPKLDKRPNMTVSSATAPPDTPSMRPNVQEVRASARKPTSEQLKGEIQPQESERPLPSVKSAAAFWSQSPKPTQPGQLKSPVKLPTRKDEEAALEEAGLRSKRAEALVSKTPSTASDLQQDRNHASPATESPKSPPLPGKKPISIKVRATSTTLSPTTVQPIRSAVFKPSEASELFVNIFDETGSRVNTNIDTQTVVNSRVSDVSSQKIKTLRKQIFEVASNGKSVPVPSQQEHILFDDSLYLCTHVFGNPSGQRTTEVYLWCGDGASSSSVEDAQVFAKKVAKECNGKFIILKQGKETTNFFQALGGIVITRRGSSSRTASSTGSEATYILCGRQHVGQIAFDEVDFTPRSLCTGFPYIVSTSRKLYLWKGSGSYADELGCARLIGMDLGITGDIEEIDEGREPDAFWKSFAEGKRNIPTSEGTSAKHWHLKPSCEKYSTRLFAVDAETPRPKSSTGFMSWGRRGSAPSDDPNAVSVTQITEIMPFAQSDLALDGVFVLDAFFEVFIIFTIRSFSPAPQHKSTKSATFRAALVFAQEYGILAASAEDRPFVPVSSVVICSTKGPGNTKEAENIPEGMQRAFRKWDTSNMGECKVLPLTAALEATG